MLRRDVLQAVFATIGLGGVGGCLGDAPPSNGGSPGDGEPPEPSIASTDFEVIDITAGMETNEATIDAEDLTVTVRGTIPGSDGCYTAELADVTDGERLRLTVRSRRRETTGTPACTQAIVEIQYRATVTYAESLPEHAEVVHEAMGDAGVVTSMDLHAVG